MNLWRHIAWCAQEPLSDCRFIDVFQRREVRKSEIADLHSLIGCDHDVFRFHITVNEAASVSDRETLQTLSGYRFEILIGDGTINVIAQALAVDEFHDEKIVIPVIEYVVNSGDMRIVQYRSVSSLFHQPRSIYGVVPKLRADAFDRDRSF